LRPVFVAPRRRGWRQHRHRIRMDCSRWKCDEIEARSLDFSTALGEDEETSPILQGGRWLPRLDRLPRHFSSVCVVLSAVVALSHVVVHRGAGSNHIAKGLGPSEAFIVQPEQGHEAPLAHHSSPKPCGRIERGVEYLGEHISSANGVVSPEFCRTMCQEKPACRMWTYGVVDGVDQTCSMLTAPAATKEVKKTQVKHVISGTPFTWDAPNTLFCFALMMPRGYEQDLLKMQLDERWNIFGCDEYQVVSNETVRLAPGVITSRIKSDLQAELGGEFGTALNTEIFFGVWRKVIEEGRWRYHDWTVKADPDTAFFPQRLRVVIAFHSVPVGGMYLNNCEYGLHGPLEVFSREAIARWHAGEDECKRHFDKLCKGPCLWGEDMFIDQCLQKVLKVPRVDDWNLLSEPHCSAKDWDKCESQHVSFHPFKTKAKYAECLQRAKFGAMPFSA